MSAPAGPRVLYLMHVDARWIKQRPHFLAEELRAAGCGVQVRYLRAWRARQLAPSAGLDGARALPALPPVTDWVRWRLNALIARAVLALVTLRRPPEVVWLTHPRMWWCVPRRLRARVVYDAMDIAAAFPGRSGAHLLRSEQELCTAARHVLCSSERIAEHLGEQYGRTHARSVVRNAVDDRTDWVLPAPGAPTTAPPRLLYFGTIAEWLDVELLLGALDTYPELVVELVGPADVELPAHPRLVHRPPVAHADLPALAATASALVMPFRVTPLVEAVDPVKLYEYVAMGRPAIACWYPGLAHFEGLVHLYRDRAGFLDTVGQVVAGTLAAPPAGERFVSDNSWRTRAGEVLTALGGGR